MVFKSSKTSSPIIIFFFFFFHPSITTTPSQLQLSSNEDVLFPPPFFPRTLCLGTSTFGAEDVVSVGEESATHQRTAAAVAVEAVAVPVALLERDELCATKTSDGLGTFDAFLGEEITEAVSTVRLVLARRELLSRQRLVTVGAGETLLMPWCTLVRDAALVDHAIALETPLCKVLLIARHTDDFLIARDETLVPDRLLTHRATETLLMPLLPLVLKLLHASLEDVGTAVTAGSKVVIMAVSAVELVLPGRERLIHQTVRTVHTLEALLMPVFVLVRQILGVGADGRLTLLTRVGKEILVALDAVRMFLTQDVTVTGQVKVTVPAAEVTAMPILIHGFGVLAREDQL